MQLGVDAAGVPYRKTITMVAEHPWQTVWTSAAMKGNSATREGRKKVVTGRGVAVSRWRCRGGGVTDAARQGTEEYKLPR